MRAAEAIDRKDGTNPSRPWAWLDHPMTYVTLSPVLSVLGAGTMLAAPNLLDPIAFGAFALLGSLYQAVAKFDLGLSQLADRDLSGTGARDVERAAAILRARRIVALAGLALLLPILVPAAIASGRVSALDVVLALVAGLAGMAAVGPVTVFRAQGRVREFTMLALALQAGLTLPRLTGLLLGGVTGSFGVLAAWFLGLALLGAIPSGRDRPRHPVLPVLRAALPLFAFSWLWLVYLVANRWISAGLSDDTDLGLFSFGANLAFTAVGLLATVAQVRYPTILAQAGADRSCGRLVEREAWRIGCALTLAVACALPLVPAALGFAFPRYVGAAGVTAILAVSCVPLGVTAWFMPVVIALSPSPVRDGIRTLAAGFVALVAGMVLGDRVAGIEGQAWGCVAGAVAAFAGMMLALRRLGLLTGRGWTRVALVVVIQAMALSLFAAMVAPARAEPDHGPKAGWVTAFEDSFEALKLWDRSGGTWQPSYPWGARTNADNRETQYYVDPRPGRDAPALQKLAPFRLDPGSFSIVARPLGPDLRPYASGLPYASGMLSSAKSFNFTYGYVEIEARIPRGKGTWPAFWLLPTRGGWPPEIDVMEVLGDDVDGYWATLHTMEAGKHAEVQRRVAAPDLSEAFHTYGVRWTAEEVAWYLDGKRVFSTPTPSDMHGPMYLLVNLAIGGKWPGAPDAATKFPAEFQVRRIRVLVPKPDKAVEVR